MYNRRRDSIAFVKWKGRRVCIRGPGVFKGYLGAKTLPFVQIGNEEWYRSGDRGFLDEEGNLILTGRLKRFVKIGGEMVSLGGLEEELIKLSLANNWIEHPKQGPNLAVSVNEKESGRPQIVLYTTFPIKKKRKLI